MFLRQSREGQGRERGESEKSSCGGIGSLEEGSCLVHRCQTMRVGGGGGGRERERERERDDQQNQDNIESCACSTLQH